jgi:hypothetical protein
MSYYRLIGVGLEMQTAGAGKTYIVESAVHKIIFVSSNLRALDGQTCSIRGIAEKYVKKI